MASPLLGRAFEPAVANSIQRQQSDASDYDSFSERGAIVMRELVCGTYRIVIRNDVVIKTPKTEIIALL